MESKKVDAPTESMYAKAASLFVVDDGGKMTVKQAMNFAGFSPGDCKIEKHLDYELLFLLTVDQDV